MGDWGGGWTELVGRLSWWATGVVGNWGGGWTELVGRLSWWVD